MFYHKNSSILSVVCLGYCFVISFAGEGARENKAFLEQDAVGSPQSLGNDAVLWWCGSAIGCFFMFFSSRGSCFSGQLVC